MSGARGISWLAWLIAGPTVWAVAFSAAYALHGLGCEMGWSLRSLGPVSVQRAAILLVGLVAALMCLGLLSQVERRLGVEAGLPRVGIWIGLVAILFTLAPVLVASTC